MVWATARTTAQVTPPRGSWFVIRWIVASAVGGPLLIAAIALAVVHDAASVIGQLQTPNALGAFAGVLMVQGLGALIGVGSRIGPRVPDTLGLPWWVRDAVRPALVGVATLLVLSSAVVACPLVVHWGTMQELFGITDSFFGQLSLTLLSVLYLPNVVLGAAAVAVGFQRSHRIRDLQCVHRVRRRHPRAAPILAAAPTPPLGPIWVSLLIIGAVSGVAIGQQCARHPLPFRAGLRPSWRWRPLIGAVILALLALAGSGQLGNFGHVGVDQATFGPWVFFWFFVIGGMTVVMARGISRGPGLPRIPRRAPPPKRCTTRSPTTRSTSPTTRSTSPKNSPTGRRARRFRGARRRVAAARPTGERREPAAEDPAPPPPVKPAPISMTWKT